MNESARRSTATPWKTIALVFVAALIVRGAVVYSLKGNLASDPDGYRRIAENVASRGVFSSSGLDSKPVPTAFRPPLYPLLLRCFARYGQIRDAAIGVLHVLLGAATVVLTYALAVDWLCRSGFENSAARGALLAAILVLCDPILLNQSALVMTETVATLLAVVALAALSRFDRVGSARSAGVAGASLALAALCRPTFLIWIAISAVVMSILPATGAEKAKRLAAFSAAVLLTLAPWTVRNFREFGKPIFATTHGGYTLYLANNASFYRHLREAEWGSTWDAAELPRGERANDPAAVNVHFEIRNDQRDYRLAWESIQAEPKMFIYSSLVRIGRLWRPLPHRLEGESSARRMLRYATGAWYAGVFLLALLGVVALRRKFISPPWLWGGVLCLSLTCMHAVFWSNMRMRAPLMPMVAILAAAGVAELSRHWQRNDGSDKRL